MLRISRDSGWADKARSYQVMLNGEPIGTIRDGEEKSFPVPDGRHELAIKIDWCRCDPLPFEVAGGKTVAFECGSGLRGAKIFIGFVSALFLRNRSVWLKNAV